LGENMSCKHKVKPFPYEFCYGCMLNGCYPWNRNPLLLCSLMGGLHIVLVEKQESGAFSCLNYKRVDAETWKAYLEDLKQEATLNEVVRGKAMKGETYSSELLPAEYVESKHG